MQKEREGKGGVEKDAAVPQPMRSRITGLEGASGPCSFHVAGDVGSLLGSEAGARGSIGQRKLLLWATLPRSLPDQPLLGTYRIS